MRVCQEATRAYERPRTLFRDRWGALCDHVMLKVNDRLLLF